ncbi:unnamed protein product [Penicillium salamii]|uniref:Chaperonin Cpn10 n=1 Tax=Penicillium salamii TaxID=1612424 RepID=A0A9W4NEV4_9EURO|nr:unnamed protein product [Penicillium salamii]CAG7965974.1 unnamed protein product [Penicillium salamii]CAG8002099.1 unnamed protein product [Penicillium salamii]CAG8053188.1 unnamed protein product [Penicillium salamii]CAG8073184.1 unnamed protein product [Penicillium salamii]
MVGLGILEISPVRSSSPGSIFFPSPSSPTFDPITPFFIMSILRNIKSLTPLLDRVLVQRIKPEAKTASGIFLPEAAVKEQNEAQVLAVGPGLFDKDGKRLPMGVAAGDKVLIPQFGGNSVKVGEEEYTLFRDHDILAKIKE